MGGSYSSDKAWPGEHVLASDASIVSTAVFELISQSVHRKGTLTIRTNVAKILDKINLVHGLFVKRY